MKDARIEVEAVEGRLCRCRRLVVACLRYNDLGHIIGVEFALHGHGCGVCGKWYGLVEFILAGKLVQQDLNFRRIHRD